MNWFTASRQQEAEFDAYSSELERLQNTLEPLAPAADFQEITKLGKRFQKQTADFFQENRRLNIGVVGQVKAGKSSFLNTMLFNGLPILPKASTPKTAVLTKIEYAPENQLEVHYLSRRAWEALEDDAAEARAAGETTSARELVEMAETRSLNPSEKLDKVETIPCSSVEELQDVLNDYVGENGQYTPLVEFVTLGVNQEELRELSIVDTPGLNDPVTSRTDQTKRFLEICDVVFFLSQSSSFLDSSDWLLLSEQLPNQGVKRLVLVASKADSAVLDLLPARKQSSQTDPLGGFGAFGGGFRTVPTRLSLREALEQARTKLGQRARREIQKFGERPGGRNSTAYRVLSGCQTPYLVSAMLENMCSKPREEYDPEEENIYERLEPHFEDAHSDMARIGNFGAVREVFERAVREKDEILRQKGQELIPTARASQRALLEQLRGKAAAHRDALAHGDQDLLQKRLNAVQRQSSALRGDVAAVFGEASSSLEAEKAGAISEMRKAGSEYQLKERSGEEVHYEVRVSYRHHFLFFRWGREETPYQYTTHYKYLVAADVKEELRHYTNALSSWSEEVFQDAIHLQDIKARLLNAVVKNLDTSADSFDAGLCKQVAEAVIQTFSFPVFSVSFQDEFQEISDRFQGEVTAATEMQELNNMFNDALASVLDKSVKALDRGIEQFQTSLKDAGDHFSERVLARIQGEYESLLQKLEDKQRELEHCQNYVDCLEDLLKQEETYGAAN